MMVRVFFMDIMFEQHTLHGACRRRGTFPGGGGRKPPSLKSPRTLLLL